LKNHISGGSHFELSNMVAPLRIGFGSWKIWQSISKITSIPIFMLLYKFAHSLMRIPLTALTSTGTFTFTGDQQQQWFD